RHPNIVQIYDYGEVDGQNFLALEYVELGSLRDRLSPAGGQQAPPQQPPPQPVEPRVAAMLLEQVARAVQHAHRLGVLRRDIKPANILLAQAGDSVAAGNAPLPAMYRSPLLEAAVGGQPPPSWVKGSLAVLLPEQPPPLAGCTPKLTDFGLAE